MDRLWAIISARRAASVPRMERLLAGLNPWWFVPGEEASEYQYAGAERLWLVDGLSEARNLALDVAFERDQMCVQVDDDLHPWKGSTCGMAWTPDGNGRRDLTVTAAADAIEGAMNLTGAKLGGMAPTTNLFFYPKQAVSRAHFIIGSFMLVAPSPIRHDATFLLKEDYDFTLQHLREYGVVARHNGVLGNFRHYTNRGGAVATRTPDLEAEMCKLLIERWPDNLRPNPRRENELLLRWKE